MLCARARWIWVFWRKERKEEELAVTLEHQYTQDGLKLDTLKGVDRSRADTLSRRLKLERWYYRAAVVIWPRERHFLVLCGAGTDASVGGLQALVSQWKRAAKSCRDQQRQACCEFAAAIIESWQPSHNWRAGIDGSVAGIWPARYLSDQRSPSRDR